MVGCVPNQAACLPIKRAQVNLFYWGVNPIIGANWSQSLYCILAGGTKIPFWPSVRAAIVGHKCVQHVMIAHLSSPLLASYKIQIQSSILDELLLGTVTS